VAKKSVALDLNSPADAEAFDGLVATADIMLPQPASCVPAKLGIDVRSDALRALSSADLLRISRLGIFVRCDGPGFEPLIQAY